MHIPFFFQLMVGFHMDLLMGIFANLRFANTVSGFGLVNLILAILTLLFLGGLLGVSILKQRRIEQALSELKSSSSSPREIKQASTLRQNKLLKKSPETKFWYFQKEGIKTKLSGYSCYYYQWNIAKEILTIFFVLIFVDYPLVQLIPLLVMTAGSIAFLIFKRPLDSALMNIFTIVVEFLYFLLFVGLLVFKLTSESVSRGSMSKYDGVTMIVIVCLILGAFITLGICQTVYSIYLLCRKKPQKKTEVDQKEHGKERIESSQNS